MFWNNKLIITYIKVYTQQLLKIVITFIDIIICVVTGKHFFEILKQTLQSFKKILLTGKDYYVEKITKDVFMR